MGFLAGAVPLHFMDLPLGVIVGRPAEDDLPGPGFVEVAPGFMWPLDSSTAREVCQVSVIDS